MLGQNVQSTISDQLLTNEWRGQTLPPKFGDLVSSYNQEYKLLRMAAHAEVPGDWGLDLTEGPELLLPQLAPAKKAALIARLRTMWDLQNGRPAEAREDLLATLALARNVSRDGTLISVLVQIAMENILISTIAENFYQLPPETLQELEAGFEAAPARGTAAQAVATGERAFPAWFTRKVQEARQQHPGDDAAAMVAIRAFMQNALGSSEGETETNKVDRMFKAAGGTSDGILKLLAEMSPTYDRAVAIMSLPHPEYEKQAGQFATEIQNSPNPFLNEFFPALSKSRVKEFVILEKLAMLHAAIEYKLHGEEGFNRVADPAGTGPFGFERFIFEGVDRGFKLKANFDGAGYQEVMIFTEKAGAPFQVSGPHAGEAIPPSTAP
jgi:hypothetical protein